jgi:phosphoribosylanthranilate isomerase
MTVVKICGITNLEDALASVAAGADALGFNFYRPSPRYIEPRKARAIIEQLPQAVLTVCVFVNEASPADVERIATEAGVAAIQLHGDEAPEYCAALNARPVIKALRVKDGFDPAGVGAYQVSAIMLDGFHPHLRGGTGRVVDWSLARQAKAHAAKLFLAGGLSPENVGEAISAVAPYAIDACSALEREPGIKDHERLKAFLNAARAAD